MAANGIAHTASDNESDPRWTRLTSVGEPVHHNGAAAGAMSPAQHGSEILTATKPRCGGQHAAQADSASRPLRRRAPRMARPARVRIRNRKPCVLARRRLLG